MNKPILCLDFDGVIHSYTTRWNGPNDIPDPPVPGAFEFIREAQTNFDVVIYSTRSTYPYGIQAMRNWMKEHGFEDVDSIEWAKEKPPAMVTIDDRALTFTGVWPDIQELLRFKPWNKK